jgi:enoyl-CoA hydratase/carnithine racemase
MAIEFSIGDAVATITINRPDKENALDAEHYRDLSRAWIEVRDDDAIRAAVITGAGDRTFCAGADLASYVGREQSLSDLWLTQREPLLNRGLEVWKPVVAAVNGACLGGGLTLLLATDIRVASSSARFGLPEVKRGVVAANGGTQRLIQQLPQAIAMEMLLLGETIDAARAERFGLVNQVVDPQSVLPTALDIALRLAGNAPLAVQAAKELAWRSRDTDLGTGLRMEQLANSILRGSRDAKEAREAFNDRRAPTFEGK